MPSMHDDWKQAKKAFETLTGKHKPAETFLLLFHKGTDIDSCLKVCDTLVAANPIDTKKLTAAMKKLKDASDGYLATLKAEKAVATGGSKDIITVVSKGISSLKQSLKKYEAYFETVLKEAEVMAGAGNPKQKMIDAMLIPYKAGVKTAVANAKAAAARLQTVAIKISTDDSKLPLAVAIYNKEMNANEAAREADDRGREVRQHQKHGRRRQHPEGPEGPHPVARRLLGAERHPQQHRPEGSHPHDHRIRTEGESHRQGLPVSRTAGGWLGS